MPAHATSFASTKSPSRSLTQATKVLRQVAVEQVSVVDEPVNTSLREEAASEEVPNHLRLFESLAKRGIKKNLIKALTESPFKFREMTEVQYQVFQHLDSIVSPLQGSVPLPGFKLDDQTGPAPSKEMIEKHHELGKIPTKDLLVKAKTGTGKTVAFLVPAIEARMRAVDNVATGQCSSSAFSKLLSQNQPNFNISELIHAHRKRFASRTYARNTVGTLIISPTRELASQIAHEARKLSTALDEFSVHLLIGGDNKHRQLRIWERARLDIVVATPGRLLQHLHESSMVKRAVSATETLILDEADTLLEMGFREDLERITEFLPPKTQRRNLLFSATFSKEIAQVADSLMSPGRQAIDCVPAGEKNVHERVPQQAYVVESGSHFAALTRLIAKDQLIHGRKSRVIVFCPTARLCQLMAAYLRDNDVRKSLPINVLPPTKQEEQVFARRPQRKGLLRKNARDAGLPDPTDRFDGEKAFKVIELHSKLHQRQRDRVSGQFRNTDNPCVLVTTDVSARGVDYPNVSRVVQFGSPQSKDQYVHRVGRTGRAGKDGRADMILLQGFEENWLRFAGADLPVNVHANGDAVLRKEICELWDQVRAERNALETTPSADDSPVCTDSFNDVIKRFLADSTGFDHIIDSKDTHGFGSDASGKQVFERDEDGDARRALNLVYSSMVAYYMAQISQFRINKGEAFRHLQNWAMAQLGLSEWDAALSPRLRVMLGIGNIPMGDGSGRRGGGRNSGSFEQRGRSGGKFGGSSRGGNRGYSRSDSGGNWAYFSSRRDRGNSFGSRDRDNFDQRHSFRHGDRRGDEAGGMMSERSESWS